MTTGITDIALLRQVLSAVLGVLAVNVGSRRGLALWVSVANLPRPTLEQTEKPDATASTQRYSVSPTGDSVDRPDAASRWYSKANLKPVLIAMTGWAAISAIYMVVMWKGTQLLVDIMWSIVGGLFSLVCIIAGIDVAFPHTDGVYRVYDVVKKNFVLKTHTLVERRDCGIGKKGRTVIACLASASIVAAGWHGSDFPSVIVPAFAILMVMSNIPGERVSIRKIVIVPLLIMVGMTIAFAVIGLVVFACVRYFGNDTDGSDSTSSDSKPNVPNACLQSIVNIWNGAMPILAPGILLGVTYRYEAARVDLVSRATFTRIEGLPGTTDDPTKPRLNRINWAVPPFPTPLFRIGNVALIAVLGATLSLHAFKATQELAEFIRLSNVHLFATGPVVFMALSCAAWKRGELRQWWSYEETWMPSVSDMQSASEPDDVALLANVDTDSKV